jgi:hypothetical protein
VGTVGTLAAALWQNRNERNRRLVADAQLRDERHRKQARLGPAYIGELETTVEDGAAPAHDRGRTACYLTNNSPEPVYSVVVGIVFLQGGGPHIPEEMLDLNRKQYNRRGPVTTVSILAGGLYHV